MNLDRAVFVMTGILVLASLALGVYVHPLFYLLTAFVGLNLILAGAAGVCFSALVLRMFGLKPGSAKNTEHP